MEGWMGGWWVGGGRMVEGWWEGRWEDVRGCEWMDGRMDGKVVGRVVGGRWGG